jgi:hypothetical protein
MLGMSACMRSCSNIQLRLPASCAALLQVQRIRRIRRVLHAGCWGVQLHAAPLHARCGPRARGQPVQPGPVLLPSLLQDTQQEAAATSASRATSATPSCCVCCWVNGVSCDCDCTGMCWYALAVLHEVQHGQLVWRPLSSWCKGTVMNCGSEG